MLENIIQYKTYYNIYTTYKSFPDSKAFSYHIVEITFCLLSLSIRSDVLFLQSSNYLPTCTFSNTRAITPALP